MEINDPRLQGAPLNTGISKASKHDKGKPPIAMINRVALEQEALVLAFGADKYGRDNWKQGMEHQRLLDAAMRHLVAFTDGEEIDPESGLSHLAHVRAGLGFLMYYKERDI